MKKKHYGIIAVICAVLVVALAYPTASTAKKRIVFGGGPAGGTFQIVANAIQTYDGVKGIKEFNVQAQSSAGSLENLRKANSGKHDFSVVYAGDLFIGRNGMLEGDSNKYEDVLGVAYLFGAPAQLVVKAGSGIKSAKDLVGKKVGVGNAGSGAFANCERFFRHLGIWDKIERNAMGYDDAAAAFGNNQLDAFWLFTAYPSGAVVMAAQTNDVSLIDIHKDAEASGYYKAFPYFTKLTIPGGTYKGVDKDVDSFQDSTLWVANRKVPDDVVYKLLSAIYTDEGLAYMIGQKKTFTEMTIKDGTKGMATPMHPGAIKFWKEKGVIK